MVASIGLVEYLSLDAELKNLRARNEKLTAALKVCHQALIETVHAQEVGASWYTHGADGLYRQVNMWVRKGLAAIASVGVSA
jgi:hypothetical protein